MLIAPSEVEHFKMLKVKWGMLGVSEPVSMEGLGVGISWLVGWFSCPNSSIFTKPLLKENGVPSWSNDNTTDNRERKEKYWTYKVSITWMIGHILFFFFLLSLFHLIFLALKRLTMIWPATV